MSGKIGRVCKSLLAFDILAGDVQLTVGGGHHIPTRVGTFLSFACVTVFTLLSCLSIASYFDTSKPKTATETSTLPVKPVVNVKKNYHYPIIFFLENEAQYLNWAEAEKYFHVSFYHLYFKLKEDGSEEGVRTDLKFVPCAELIARGKLDTFKVDSEGFVKSYYEKFGFCVDDEGKDLILGGAERSIGYESLGLYFSPCSLQDGSCKGAEELKKIGFLIANPAASVSIGNYNQPVKYITEQQDFERLVSEFYQTRVVDLVSNQILEDRGLLFQTKMTHAFTTIHVAETKIAPRDKNQITCSDPSQIDCIPYFALNFLLTNTQIVITREYKGVVELIGEIGGAVKAVVAVFSVIYNLYYNSIKSKEFMKLIYGLPRDSPGVPKVHANRLKEELDILRIVRELKVLKFLMLKANPSIPVLNREELMAENSEMFRYIEEPSSSNLLLNVLPDKGQTAPGIVPSKQKSNGTQIIGKKQSEENKEKINRVNQSFKSHRGSNSLTPKPALLQLPKNASLDESRNALSGNEPDFVFASNEN